MKPCRPTCWLMTSPISLNRTPGFTASIAFCSACNTGLLETRHIQYSLLAARVYRMFVPMPSDLLHVIPPILSLDRCPKVPVSPAHWTNQDTLSCRRYMDDAPNGCIVNRTGNHSHHGKASSRGPHASRPEHTCIDSSPMHLHEHSHVQAYLQGRSYEPLGVIVNRPYCEGFIEVSMEALVVSCDIHIHNVSILQRALIRNAMANHLEKRITVTDVICISLDRDMWHVRYACRLQVLWYDVTISPFILSSHLGCTGVPVFGSLAGNVQHIRLHTSLALFTAQGCCLFHHV